MGMPIIVPGTGTRCQAVTDIIESVALEQTALSHIINAEGEKIQYALLNGGSTTTALEVNKSVKSMIDTISKLEMLLQSKLSLFEDCLCVCDETCIPLQDTELVADNPDSTVIITKGDKNNWNILATVVDFPSSYTITPTPNIPIIANNLPENVTFENNVITYQEAASPVELIVGEGECAETVTITVTLRS